MKSIKRNEIMKCFKIRLKTQDRGSKLPMRAVLKFYKGNKKILDQFDDTAKNIRFLTSEDGKEFTLLKDIDYIEIDKHSFKVNIIKNNGEKELLYTEVFNRVLSGGRYEPLIAETKSLKSLTLDHDIPISCLLRVKGLSGKYLEELNHLYSDFISEHKNLKKDSDRAREFYNSYKSGDIIDKTFLDNLLNEVIKILKTGSITVMERSYNASKNNGFKYCDELFGCPNSKLKQLIDKYSNK